MGAYKKLNKQDAFITVHTARKEWSVSGGDFTSYGIEKHLATGSYLTSLQQLYYPTKILGEIVSHSYDYHYETTLENTNSRNLITGSHIYSIPRNLFGTHIEPGNSFSIILNIISGSRPVIQDDGEGLLYLSGSSPKVYVGDSIYAHGICIITSQEYIDIIDEVGIYKLNWKSNHRLYTHSYRCRIGEFEYNSTYNPSAQSKTVRGSYDNQGELYESSGSLLTGDKDINIVGIDFQPYITTIGLYNDVNELIAVGKLGQPVPKSANTEMTMVVKIDI